MNFDEFTGQVQQRARLASTGETMAAIRATLTTLSERLQGGATSNLAAELPTGIKEYLTDRPTAESFGLDEFFRRVSARENRDLPEAIHHARAVVSVLRDALSQGAIDNARAQLPDEYDPLFEAGSEGEMRREAGV